MTDIGKMWDQMQKDGGFSKLSTDAQKQLKKHVLDLPYILRNRVDCPVTMEDLFKARIEVAQHLQNTDVVNNYATFLRMEISANQQWLEELPRKLASQCPHDQEYYPQWTRQGQLLFHAGLGTEAIKLQQEGKLTFSILLELNPNALFPCFG